jgi:hypothetical protein
VSLLGVGGRADGDRRQERRALDRDRGTHYLKIFEYFDPANRTSAEEAIRAAREPGVSGVRALFETGGS